MIVSMLIAMGLYAFKYAVGELKREKVLIPKKAIEYNFLRGAFQSIYFYVIEKYDELGLKERPKMYYLFDGREKEVFFVTSSPIHSETIALSHLFFDKDKLFYEESPIYDFRQNFKDPVILKNSKKYLVLDKIKEGRFFYKKRGEFKNSFNGDIPRVVKMEYKSNNKTYFWVFAINSYFYDHKKYLYNEKYPF